MLLLHNSITHCEKVVFMTSGYCEKCCLVAERYYEELLLQPQVILKSVVPAFVGRYE